MLGANAVDARTGLPAYLPFAMKTMKVEGQRPVRVGVLGLTNPGIAIWDKANVEGKLRFTDLVEVGQVLGADHAAARRGRGHGDRARRRQRHVLLPGDLPMENASAMVAEQVPGIDAVLFGHAHNEVAEKFVTNKVTGKQVLLTEPSRWGQRLSVMDFKLTGSTAAGRSPTSRPPR